MDRKYIDDNDVISRYLSERLTESELISFETFMIANSDVAGDVEREFALQSSLRSQFTKANVESTFPRSLDSGNELGANLAGLGTVAINEPRRWGSRSLGLAASVLMITSLLFSALMYRNAESLKHEVASLRTPQPVQGVFQFEKTKSGTAGEQVIVADSPVVLWLDVGPEKFPRYAIQIAAENGEIVWRENSSILMDNFSIGVFLQGLDVGRYTIAVTAFDDTGADVDIAKYWIVSSL